MLRKMLLLLVGICWFSTRAEESEIGVFTRSYLRDEREILLCTRS